MFSHFVDYYDRIMMFLYRYHLKKSQFLIHPNLIQHQSINAYNLENNLTLVQIIYESETDNEKL